MISYPKGKQNDEKWMNEATPMVLFELLLLFVC